MRMTVAAAVACLIGGVTLADDAQAAIRRSTNIVPQALAPALRALARDRDLQVVYQSEVVGDRQTAGAAGDLTLEETLTLLLKGTGLTFEYLGEQAVTIIPVRSKATGFLVPAQAESSTSGGASSGNLDSVQLEEVLVTAQKREERLQEVPVPVTAITAETLLSTNQLRLQDYYSTVPGLNVAPSPSGPGSQMVTIRGITSGFNTNPTVGITVDDVPFGSSTNLVGNVIPDIDPNDLARVEVLRGPQGTLYGASSMGGLLKFVTVDPTAQGVSGRVQAGLSSIKNGDDAGYNVRGLINLPLGDTLAMRASAFARRDPGYIDNPVLGRKGVNEIDTYGARIATLWRPSEVLSVKLSALVQKVDGDGLSDIDVKPGLGDLEQDYAQGVGPFERKVQAYSAIVTARLGQAELTSITGYNVNTLANTVDLTYLLGGLTQSLFNAPTAAVVATGENRKLSQEIRLSTAIGRNLDWLSGAFYTHEHAPYAEQGWALDAAGQIQGNLIYAPAPRRYREIAGFTDLTWHVTDRFDVQLGGRESHITTVSEEATQAGVLGAGITPRADSTADAFTYLLTPRMRFSDELMVYARLASGYRTGGVNFNPDLAVPRVFEPDKTQNYEIGLKGNLLDRVLTYDVSLYRIDWKDLQLNLTHPTNFQTYTANAGEARSQGVEIALEIRPAMGLKISTWAVWSDAELTGDMPADNTVTGASGDRLPFSARFSANLALDQEFALSGETSAFVGATVSHVGARSGTFVSAPARQPYPSYTKGDLRGGVRREDWTLSLFLTNVTDERGVLGGGIGTFPPYAFSYLQPRTLGLNVARSF